MAQQYGFDEQDEVAAEVRLMNHNQRLNEILTDAFDKKVAAFENQLDTTQHELKQSQKAREDLGMSLHYASNQARKVSAAYEASRKEIAALESDKKSLLVDNKHLQEETRRLQQALENTEIKLSATQEQHAATAEELHTAKQLGDIFTADLKMHRQLRENLEAELGAAQRQNKEMQNMIKSWEQKFDRIAKEKNNHSTQLEVQQNENRNLLSAYDRLSKEMELCRNAQDVLGRQWKDAVQAMEMRDQNCISLEERHVAAQTRIYNLEADNAQLKAQLDKAKRSWDETKRVAARDEQHKQQAQECVGGLEQENIVLRNELSTVISQLQVSLQSAEDARKKEKQLLDKISRAEEKLALTQAELRRVQKRDPATTASTLSQDTVEKVADELDEKYQKELKTSMDEIVALSRTQQTQRIKIAELEHKLREAMLHNGDLVDEVNRMGREHRAVAQERSNLLGEVERKTYLLNKLENRTSEQRRAPSPRELTPAEQVTAREYKQLQAEYSELKGKFDKLQHGYMKERLDSVNANSSNDKLAAALTLTQALNNRTELQAQKNADEVQEAHKDVTDARVKQRRAERALADAKREIETLRARLEDALRVSHLRQDDAAEQQQIAEFQVNALRNEQTATQRFAESCIVDRERNRTEVSVMAEQAAKQKAVIAEQSRQIFQLQVKLRSAERSHAHAEKQFQTWMKQYEANLPRKLDRRVADRQDATALGEGGEISATTAKPSAKAVASSVPSLRGEGEKVMLGRRLSRARAVAAHLERQLLKYTGTIDYAVPSDVEPSPQLNGILCAINRASETSAFAKDSPAETSALVSPRSNRLTDAPFVSYSTPRSPRTKRTNYSTPKPDAAATPLSPRPGPEYSGVATKSLDRFLSDVEQLC